jgi:hypothetical protein
MRVTGDDVQGEPRDGEPPFLHKGSEWHGAVVPSGVPDGTRRASMTEATWAECYATDYAHHARTARACRRARGVRRASAAAAREPTDTEAMMADLRRTQAESRRRLVELRLERGHVWRGRFVAGDSVYRRAPQITLRLISEDHPILKLFVSKLPRGSWRRDPARRLKSGPGKELLEDTDSKLLALDEAYVEANRYCCGVLRVDIDRVVTLEEVLQACDDAGVSPPNIIVGWTDSTGKSYNPHLLWLIENSVPITTKAPQFGRLFRGVLYGLTKALLPLGADPNGLFNAHRHKNAVSPLWDRVVIAPAPYQLATLKSQVDITCTQEALAEAAVLLGQPDRHVPDHPDPEIAAGSNWLFGKLSSLARREVGRFRVGGHDEAAFAAWLHRKADLLVEGSEPGEQDARAHRTVATVSAWTWNNYRGEPARPRLSGDERARAHAEGGRKGAAKRKDGTRAAIMTFVERQAGAITDKAGINAALTRADVCSLRTAYRHWPAIEAKLGGC